MKGLAAIIVFLIIAILIEYVVVIYAMDLGAQDRSLLQWTFQFPGTSWIVTIMISPLFHLVPIAVIVTLAFCWTYLTRYVAVRTQETGKRATGTASKQQNRLSKFLSKIKSGYIWRKIHFARATIKSALTVLLVFAAFIVIGSLLAYPQLIYRIVANAYQNDPSLLNFAKGLTEALAPLNAVGSAIRSVALFLAPGFREFALAFGNIIKPLASLDNDGKFLAFQNIASWASAFIVIVYVEYRKAYRFRKTRKS